MFAVERQPNNANQASGNDDNPVVAFSMSGSG
jgi:hypothetical protein